MPASDWHCTHLDAIQQVVTEREGLEIVIWSCPICGMKMELVPKTLRVFLYRGKPPREFQWIHYNQPANVIENAGALTTYEWWVRAIQPRGGPLAL